ncbi:hypothetical protein FGB62_45g129 [Gracilaria domingensis]|nr:hypothetical protein FGB62_45g129 [Gracilaria domingensis]
MHPQLGGRAHRGELQALCIAWRVARVATHAAAGANTTAGGKEAVGCGVMAAHGMGGARGDLDEAAEAAGNGVVVH